MADFLSQYSIQRWLEMCPQGYLEDTVYGHGPEETEPDELLENEEMRVASIALTVQLIAGERAALAASSGLVNAAPDDASKMFLATQTLDEARHVEIFTRRLMDLGVKKEDVNSTVADLTNPLLVSERSHLAKGCDSWVKNMALVRTMLPSRGANGPSLAYSKARRAA